MLPPDSMLAMSLPCFVAWSQAATPRRGGRTSRDLFMRPPVRLLWIGLLGLVMLGAAWLWAASPDDPGVPDLFAEGGGSPQLRRRGLRLLLLLAEHPVVGRRRALVPRSRSTSEGVIVMVAGTPGGSVSRYPRSAPTPARSTSSRHHGVRDAAGLTVR